MSTAWSFTAMHIAIGSATGMLSYGLSMLPSAGCDVKNGGVFSTCGLSASESTTDGGLGLVLGFFFAGGGGRAGAAAAAFPGGGDDTLTSEEGVSSKRMKWRPMRQMVNTRMCFHCICWMLLRACSVLKSENMTGCLFYRVGGIRALAVSQKIQWIHKIQINGI